MADGVRTQASDGSEVAIPDQRTHFINIPLHPLTGQVAEEHLERLSLYYTIYGVVFGIVGLVAILVPLFFKSLPLDQLIAWLLVVGGAATLLQFFLICGAPGTTSFLLLGALHLGVGIWMLFQRVPNSTMLVFIICAWFLIHGILKLLMACQVRSIATWPAVLTSGIVSVILAFVLFALSSWLFKESIKLLGIFIGGDLIFTAISLVLIAFMARLGKNAKETHQPLLAQHGMV
ncbi:uncharacterized protein [Physcomitrium patens]|uniref:Uncharacterized protein n=1 Tax=Physcomitrium patens TaxID=3218 RepID=A0A2K1K4D1_PHYPA|nr:uncharacterized protein LOC112286245 [Physcomitrium patens]XP_024383727.1 uncharacterized protein LOC112286245 [Physcomitrium patens]XP_024383728.1 uncharacterized protein LOC112286245 [Physcomitrium patens]XP_024383729.1 uncharacterized protein LOC112286245 [Physcomitrium patens]PNR48632.1 hypothetical protein PHYPA_013109 [Physcomitrium patens]|eukprot:XP_024383726.1 uncharacterized protein LOC112286245 [Physcomitrella patens]